MEKLVDYYEDGVGPEFRNYEVMNWTNNDDIKDVESLVPG